MISIIMPVYNEHEMTAECIRTVMEHTQNYELVIIDNGSNPVFKPPFSGMNETIYIRNDENKGFPIAINQGLAAAKGDIIILLNNDTSVTPGWAEKLSSALDEFSIVGPVTNYSAGLQQVQIDSYQNLDELDQAAHDCAQTYGDSIQEVNFVTGFCMAFKKSIADELGWWDGNEYKYFDDTIWPCSGEEIDFCFKARAGGYHIGIVEGCYIHHEGSKTFEAMERDKQLDFAEVFKKTDEHLSKKWGDKFWERQTINSSPEPKGLCLNLGCGLKHTHIMDVINIDNRSEVDPDLVCDVTKGLPYPDNSVDMIYALDLIEHLERNEVIKLIDEIYRVLKSKGQFYHRTPSDEGRGAWQDPTHKSAWNINTWRFYFVDPAYRELYETVANFKIIDLHDEWTDEENMILHTHCTYEAVK